MAAKRRPMHESPRVDLVQGGADFDCVAQNLFH